jgi:hypothetical protein
MLQDLLTTFAAFEAQAQKFDAGVLLGAGVTLLMVGLIIWLAGLSFSRIISAIVGALTGFLAAFALTAGKLSAAILACATGLIAGAILRRLIFAMAAAILAGVCVTVAVSQKTEAPVHLTYAVPAPDAPILNARESWERTMTLSIDLYKNTLASIAKQPKQVWITVAGAAVVAFLAGMLLKELAAALGCSAVGTIMSLLGLAIFLCYKGAQPVEFVADKPLLSSSIFGGMVAFGTSIQILLMRPRKGRKIVVAKQQPLDAAAPVEEQKPSSISLKPTGETTGS